MNRCTFCGELLIDNGCKKCGAIYNKQTFYCPVCNQYHYNQLCFYDEETEEYSCQSCHQFSFKDIRPTKKDQGKTPMYLLPHDVLVQIAKVLEFGAAKYGPFNWCQQPGFDWSRLISAAYRHLGEYNMGNDTDEETGLSHVAHALCCLIFLEAHRLRKLGKDDRNVR